MNPSTPDPTTRRQWAGYWCMIVLQTLNAFNDKMAQFILVALAGAVAVGFAMENYAAVLISLPLVLFAPLAGWLSDRFSKRDVLLWAMVAQMVTLAWICWAVWVQHLLWALAAFFFLSTQAAFFSPAKFGITKELIGARNIGFGASIQQMAGMIAFLTGQILSGWWFDLRYKAAGGVPAEGWWAALLPLLYLTAATVPALLLVPVIPRVPAQGSEPLSAGLLVRHFASLADLWRRKGLRRASFGVAFFWGFARFLNIWSVKVAKQITGGGEGFGTLQAQFMVAASAGMVAGFGASSLLQRRHIELGWVPAGGLCMAVMSVITALVAPGGWPFLISLAVLSFCSAIYLAPLNAWLQDNYPADKRGELQASVNLQDCLASIIGIGVLAAVPALLKPLGADDNMVHRIEVLGAGGMCLLMTWFSLKLLPGHFMRVLAVAVVRFIYRITPLHRDRLPQTGGVLLLPNHVTWADSFFVTAAVGRPVRFVMEEAFMAKPAVRWFVTLFDTITIRRDQPREAIRLVMEGLAKGHIMCLFPEGQLTRTGTLCPLQRGCELIARKSGHPVVPLWTDGTWGSIFSFERGRFFRKWPYRAVRYDIRAAFGEPMEPQTLTLPALREALCRAAAEAQQTRFRASSWGHRVPRGDEARWNPLQPDERHRLWRNGYQIGQINALRRRRPCYVLTADAVAEAIPCAIYGFATLFKGAVIPSATCNGHRGPWVGGHALRALLENAPPDEPLTFYDFSERALRPLGVPGVVHCPCFALDGLVIAMSMPDPPTSGRQDPQEGGKPGTYGKLLPGWFSHPRGDGGILLYGPAAPAGGLLLPPDLAIDEDGHLCRA